MSRTLQLLFWLLLATATVQAQRFSYVYIQGDKQTPFYVKMNGGMLPRYGKNYCILPQLEAGTITLEILFQQNVFPAQQFTIQVPESGNRAFMITRRDQSFSLYDLQQHFYLPAGNNAGDDHLPAIASSTPAVIANATIPEETEETVIPTPAKESRKEPTEEIAYRRTHKKKDAETTTSEVTAQPAEPTSITEGQPQFLDHVKLNNEHEQLQDSSVEVPHTDTVFTQKKPLDITFKNSDCPQPLPDAEFERIYKAMMEKQADEDRVEYLNGQLDKCYQTWQARTLGTMLTEDAARFTFLKNVYPHITDQQAFPLLDDMLRSDVWKAQFVQLTHR